MTKRECGECPALSMYCGKWTCAVRSPRRYIKHIAACSNAGKWTADGFKVAQA